VKEFVILTLRGVHIMQVISMLEGMGFSCWWRFILCSSLLSPCSLIDGYQHFRGSYCHHILKMQTVYSSKVLVPTYQTTQCYNSNMKSSVLSLL
jgi:hypothetical protein